MNKIKVDDLILIRNRRWTYARRIFRVHRVYKNGDLQLQFMGGKEKGELISRYGQEEVKHIGFYSVGVKK